MTCLLKHMSSSQLSSPHGCFFPAQGCPHLSAQLSCAQVSQTITAGQTPKGIQMDTRACRIAGEVQTLQAGCQNRTERPNYGQGVDTHTSSTREGEPAFGDHSEVYKIMNTEGPDKQTITHYSDTIRAEVTAQQRSKPHPSQVMCPASSLVFNPNYSGPVCATNSPKGGNCSSSKGQTLNEAQYSQNETRCTSASECTCTTPPAHKDGNVTSNSLEMSPQTSNFCPSAKWSVWFRASNLQGSHEHICLYN